MERNSIVTLQFNMSLFEWRKAVGFKQGEVAKMIGTHEMTIMRHERKYLEYYRDSFFPNLYKITNGFVSVNTCLGIGFSLVSLLDPSLIVEATNLPKQIAGRFMPQISTMSTLEWRKKMGFTQQEMADMIGCTKSIYREHELKILNIYKDDFFAKVYKLSNGVVTPDACFGIGRDRLKLENSSPPVRAGNPPELPKNYVGGLMQARSCM